MIKKPLIIAALAVGVAAVSGVAIANNNSNVHPRGADGDPVSVVSSQADSGSSNTSSDIRTAAETVAASEETASLATESSTAVDETVADNVSVVSGSDSNAPVTVTAEFGVIRVVDADTGKEVDPRVIFGHYASDCYLRMFSDCTAEICVNPSGDQTKKGTYSIYGETMYVDFGDDRMAEYPVAFDDENKIDHIIVNSGKFNIYFG